MTKVSLIIPAFNAARWLGRAVTSALRQTWSNLEVIVVDDGSTDATGELCRAFAGLVYVHQDNAGVSAARNHGIRVSKGDVIGFLDADDELRPTMVEDLMAALSRFPEAGAASGAFVEDEQGSMRRRPEAPVFERGIVEGVLPDFFAAYNKDAIVWTGSVLVRRSVLEAVGSFREEMRFGEDMELWSRIGGRYRWAFVDREVALYHLDRQSSTTLRNRFAGVEWIFPEREMRLLVLPELWSSYRLFRRDQTLNRVRALLREGRGHAARDALARISPAPWNLLWGVEQIIAACPARVAAWMTKALVVGKAAARPRLRSGQEPGDPAPRLS